MSASFSQKKIVTSNKVAAKPFCKVCHDAGKTEAEYTSHFVKSEPGTKGKVVCPTLLSQGCSYCHELGHTVSYCKVLKQNDKNKEKAYKAVAYQKESVVAVKKTATKTKGFAALGLLDEEADKIEVQEEAEYPTLRRTQVEAQAQVRVIMQAPIMSYASMANKTPINKTTPPAVTKTRAVVVHNGVKKSWADWTDSEDDDEASDCECGHCDF
jgi:CRISPR/Cas system-associated endonuclease Cas3-HD